jgi:hypothetical protein
MKTACLPNIGKNITVSVNYSNLRGFKNLAGLYIEKGEVMPVYVIQCPNCKHQFQSLVLANTKEPSEEDWAIEAFNRAVAGVKNAKIVCHICWGNWGGTPAYLPDESVAVGEIYNLTSRANNAPAPSPTSSVIPKSYEANMNVFNIEGIGRLPFEDSGLEILKTHPIPKGMMFWAGVIDVKSTVTETTKQLGVTTDCGLILLQRYIAISRKTNYTRWLKGRRLFGQNWVNHHL